MGRIFSYIMENKSHVWNHQPDVKNDHFGVSPLTNPVRCYVFQWVFCLQWVFCPWSPRNRILIWALHDAAFWSKFLVELRGPILENHADFTWSQVWLWRGKFLETPPQEKKHGFNHTFSQLWEIPTSVSSMVSICLFCSERTRTCSSWRVERAAGENMVLCVCHDPVELCLP